MEMNGILLVDKPPSMTSHDVVNILRKKLNLKKIGHAGTLDPAATGLLLMLIGTATKQSRFLMADAKSYSAVMTLGITTSTADHTGKILCQSQVPELDDAAIEAALACFRGNIRQIPPMVSAKKDQRKEIICSGA
jgi:tRNA pseudouridine synthase B (EC 4.2.1.70)